jgi:hypothetical protein
MRQRSIWVGWGLLALDLVGNAAGVVLSVDGRHECRRTGWTGRASRC